MIEPPSAPIISVVMAFHNVRRYLTEAVESVLGQSFQDFELLLVDDGATDGSDGIARSLSMADPRIRYLHHPGRVNRGISATRNLGLEEARGFYLAQVDADDVLLPDHLQHHLDLLRANPEVALVYGPVQRWYSWMNPPPQDIGDFVARPLDRYDRILEPPELLPVMLRRSYGVPLGFLCRREAMEDVGGYEDEFRGMFDDQVFFSKIAVRYPVFVSSRWTYRYRRHQESIVSVTGRSGEKAETRRRFLHWLVEYLENEGIPNRRVWWAVRAELWKCRHPHWVQIGVRTRRLVVRVLVKLRKELGGLERALRSSRGTGS